MPADLRAEGEPFRLADREVRPRLNEIEGPAGIERVNPRAMEVLLALAHRPDGFATKRELLDAVWTDLFVTEEVLTTAIWELRRALGDDARAPRFIRTVPRRGYQLLPAVEALLPAPEAAPAPASSRKGAVTPKRNGGIAWRRAAQLAAVTLLALLAAVSAVRTLLRRPTSAALPTVRSIAVLPFASLGDDPRDRALADGLTDTLITALAGQGGVRVVSRTSSAAASTGRRTIREIADALGVDAIVEGTLVRENDRLVLNAQLIDARNDSHLWAHTYERRFEHLLDLQVEIAHAIGAAISPRVGDPPIPIPTESPGTDPDGPSLLAWRFRTGGEIWSDPVLAGEALLFGSRDGFIYCLDRATGTELWRLRAGDEVSTRVLVAGNRVVAAATEGSLVATDLATGAELWRSSLATSIEIAPTLAGHRVVTADEAGRVAGFDLDSGRELWSAQVDESTDALGLAGDNVLVADWSGSLTALDPVDGSSRWSVPLGERAAGGFATDGELVAVPMVDGTLRALGASDGRELWRVALGAPTSTAIWRDRVLAAGAQGGLTALSRDHGEPLWSVEVNGAFSRPAVKDDQVLAGSRDRNLYVLDAWSGERRLRIEMQAWILTEPRIAGDLLVFGSLDGSVYAIRRSVDAREPMRIRQSDGFRLSPERSGHPPEVLVQLVDESAPAPVVRWRRRLSGGVIRAPALDRDAIYVGSGSSFSALDSGSGDELWRVRFGGEVATRPTLDGSRVLVGSRDDSLYALEIADGTEAWRFRTGGDILSSPVVRDGTVLFGSRDGYLYALDAEGGSEIWRRQLDVIHAAPTILGDAVFVATRGDQVLAHDLTDGRELWRAASDDWVVADLVAAGDRLFAASCDGTIQALASSTGEELWRFVTHGEIWFRPLVADGRLFFGSADFHLYAVDIATGREAWRFRTGNRALSSPAVWRDLVLVGSQDQSLYALDAGSGGLVWTVGAPGAIASPAVFEDTAAFGALDGSLVVLDLAPH